MEHDHTIDGRLVDVKRALPRDQAPGPARCISFPPFRFSFISLFSSISLKIYSILLIAFIVILFVILC